MYDRDLADCKLVEIWHQVCATWSAASSRNSGYLLGATMKIAVTFFKLHDMQNAVYFDQAKRVVSGPRTDSLFCATLPLRLDVRKKTF